MDRATSTEFQQEFYRTLSNAKRHPVTITNRGRDKWVLIDAAEFERLKNRIPVALSMPGKWIKPTLTL